MEGEQKELQISIEVNIKDNIGDTEGEQKEIQISIEVNTEGDTGGDIWNIEGEQKEIQVPIEVNIKNNLVDTDYYKKKETDIVGDLGIANNQFDTFTKI